MGQLFIKRLVILVFLAACTLIPVLKVLTLGVQAAEEKNHQVHQGHSDSLLILLRHKIALQKLQQQPLDSIPNTLSQQNKHLRRVMPILREYMAIPKGYYLTSDMYHESLENRAALLSGFSDILIQYQKQLVSTP